MNQIAAVTAPPPSLSSEKLMATAIRVLAMDAVEAANSGHPGAPMGVADIATVLFNRFVQIDPSESLWPDRDRFVMSAGHGSMLLYAVNHLLGYDDMGMDQIQRFRQMGSRTAGHPEYGHAKGIETTTGPLGQGVANAVGMALAERMMNARFGDDLVDHRTWVIAGDGCLMEGISQEAIDLAGHLGLGRLTLFWDDNRITIDGSTDLSTSVDQGARFAASGWHVQAVDGHDNEAIAAAIEAAIADDRPSMIACRTLIGKGAPNKQGTEATHGSPLGSEEVAAARAALGWSLPPFEVPDEVYTAWRSGAQRGADARHLWAARLEASALRDEFLAFLGKSDAQALSEAMDAYRRRLLVDRPTVATRKASEMALQVASAALPNMVGGSADLTGSNNTRAKGMTAVSRGDYSGRYIHYGIREHAMAAVMNGISLHGGLRPYGGTFLVFSDYCRPAIRLSALMRQPVVYVMTHDSIGLGEDGPTHQPIEHKASLRAIPNLMVFRPADAVETAEAWELALASCSTPSILCLSRQNLPTLRSDNGARNRTALGAYVLHEPNEPRDLTLIATGSEVELAMAAAATLAAEGRAVAVVSAPCFELFAAQQAEIRDDVLGTAPRIGIEAGVRQGWDAMLRPGDSFVGMTGFGASAPIQDLYEHFGITPSAIIRRARELMKESS